MELVSGAQSRACELHVEREAEGDDKGGGQWEVEQKIKGERGASEGRKWAFAKSAVWDTTAAELQSAERSEDDRQPLICACNISVIRITTLTSLTCRATISSLFSEARYRAGTTQGTMPCAAKPSTPSVCHVRIVKWNSCSVTVQCRCVVLCVVRPQSSASYPACLGTGQCWLTGSQNLQQLMVWATCWQHNRL